MGVLLSNCFPFLVLSPTSVPRQLSTGLVPALYIEPALSTSHIFLLVCFLGINFFKTNANSSTISSLISRTKYHLLGLYQLLPCHLIPFQLTFLLKCLWQTKSPDLTTVFTTSWLLQLCWRLCRQIGGYVDHKAWVLDRKNERSIVQEVETLEALEVACGEHTEQ